MQQPPSNLVYPTSGEAGTAPERQKAVSIVQVCCLRIYSPDALITLTKRQDWFFMPFVRSPRRVFRTRPPRNIRAQRAAISSMLIGSKEMPYSGDVVLARAFITSV